VSSGSKAQPRPISNDFWLSDSGDDLTPRAPLSADVEVDVAILGGGFSGLWTAYHLLRNEPSLEVLIVEREICGYGASGRNGGWCSPRFPVDPGALVKRFGAERARETILAQQQIVDEIGRTLDEEGIDADFRATGLLSLARSEEQLIGLAATLATYQSLGLQDGNRLLGQSETRERINVTRLHGALQSRHGANVHPGKLVRGLARTVEKLGAVICEGSEATAVRPAPDAAILTRGGTVRARKAVVVACEAYRTTLPGHRRSLLPMSSMIVLSEPLTSSQWADIGWHGGESVSSQVHTKNYLTRTCDGRILYGSRGASYLFGSAMPENAIRDEPVFEWMRGCVREWWPQLADLSFTHAWGGYLGVPRDWLPTVNFDKTSRVATLYGYTGRGVSTSALCAKLLSGLIGGWATGLESLPVHRPRAPRWEVEPFRWMGVRYVQNAFARIDEAESAQRKRPFDARFAEYLGDQ
jgi:Glycine/D-amino acid oxidases (deaminating)